MRVEAGVGRIAWHRMAWHMGHMIWHGMVLAIWHGMHAAAGERAMASGPALRCWVQGAGCGCRGRLRTDFDVATAHTTPHTTLFAVTLCAGLGR